MRRINITEDDEFTGERTLLGHFDLDRATQFDEATRWNGSNHVSVATSDPYDHQVLYRTAGGRWVLNEWSQMEGRPDIYKYVDEARAHEWLLLNEHVEDAEKYFGEVPDEVGPGRPAVGGATNLRLGDDLTARVDAARTDGESRAAAIRRLLESALSATV